MRRILLTGMIITVLVATLGQRLPTHGQESEQYKIENSTILQDTPVTDEDTGAVQSDQTRVSRLKQRGYSALISESPFRTKIKNTLLDYGDSPNVTTSVKETSVEIMYTGDGGFVMFAAGIQSKTTGVAFNATGCSLGRTLCFASLAAPWVDEEVKGFGYNVSGRQAAPDFINNNYYRTLMYRTVSNPVGVVIAQGEGDAKAQALSFRAKLNQSNVKEGTYTQPIIITILHNW